MDSAEVEELRARLERVEAIVAAIDERTKPGYELPDGYISVKQAAHLCGHPPSTIYDWVRKGRFVKSAPFGGRVYIDKSSLPKRA